MCRDDFSWRGEKRLPRLLNMRKDADKSRTQRTADQRKGEKIEKNKKKSIRGRKMEEGRGGIE